MKEVKYTNEQLKILKKYIKKNGIKDLDNDIKDIDNIYNKYNQNRGNYISNYKTTMENAFDKLKVDNMICQSNGGTLSDSTEENVDDIIAKVREYKENLESLKYLEILSEEKRTVVFVGPNGSGKTTLLRKLIKSTGEDKIGYYPADRLMIINDTYNPERNFITFNNKFLSTEKYANDITYNFQADNIKLQFDQTIALLEKKHSIDRDKGEEKPLADTIVDNWNDLIKDRNLFFQDNLCVRTLDGVEYPIKYLSSGEKSIIYFLTNILLKNKKEFYFIDEPENGLNISVVSDLWNIIESYRKDSVFVYLTHDSNFVSTRVNSKVYWIKKYDGNNDWDFERLPENDNLPQKLMIDLVGSRNPIIFCESHDEFKYDDVLFKMMFPDFSIVPSGGCDSVITKVKAYKNLSLPQKVFGIIDCDYKDDDFLKGEEKNNIYNHSFFEIENFLMCEEIVKGVLKTYSNDGELAFENLKNKLKQELSLNKEIWITRKIAYELRKDYFKESVTDITKFSELKTRYSKFKNNTDLNNLYKQYEPVIDNAINSNDYNTYLKFYDNKGIFSRFRSVMDLKNNLDYEEAVFEYLKNNDEVLKVLRDNYFSKIKI